MRECGKTYMLPLGLFKVWECLCLIISLGTTAHECYKTQQHYNKFSLQHYKSTLFHLIVCLMVWLFVVVEFCANLCHQCERIRTRKKYIVNGVFHLVLSALLFLVACIMTNNRTSVDHSDIFRVGLAFGILSSVVLLVDGVVMIVMNEAGFVYPCGGYTVHR